MKRLICVMISVVIVLCLCPPSFADWEGEPQRCIDLSLESNPSTGYSWAASSSDEEIAYVQELGFTPENEDLVGAPGTAGFRICGAAPGEAAITFAYARNWEEEEVAVAFTVPVTVDEGLNVTAAGDCPAPGGRHRLEL